MYSYLSWPNWRDLETAPRADLVQTDDVDEIVALVVQGIRRVRGG